MSIIALTPTLVISPKLQHNRLELSFQVGASLCRWRLEGQPFHWAKCQELRLCLIRLQCAREGFFFLWRCRLQFKRLHGLGLHKIHTTFRCQPPSELQYHPDFYIGICLQHITGEYQSKTTTIDGSFHSVTENHYKDQKFRPWAILRYTFRKNADKKHKLGKVLDSTEEGISILR